MHRFSQVPAFAMLQQTIAVALSGVPTQDSGDAVAMAEVVEHLASRRITLRTLEEFVTLFGDALSAVFEHGQKIGALSNNEAAPPSFAAMGRYVLQPAAANDVLGSDLRQLTSEIATAVVACQSHLPGRAQRTRRRRASRRKGGRRTARA